MESWTFQHFCHKRLGQLDTLCKSSKAYLSYVIQKRDTCPYNFQEDQTAIWLAVNVNLGATAFLELLVNICIWLETLPTKVHCMVWHWS